MAEEKNINEQEEKLTTDEMAVESENDEVAEDGNTPEEAAEETDPLEAAKAEIEELKKQALPQTYVERTC